MKFQRICCLLLIVVSASLQAQNPLDREQAPTLVLNVMVDQMRYDYLGKFSEELQGGLSRLLREGAVFTNANYDAVPTVTAVGHSTVLSGATPATSGIAANTWYSRDEGKLVQSITDDEVKPLGTSNGASPRRLRVTTVGDELKLSGRGGKVFGVSLKDRSAILPAGRSADGAFWLVDGQFVSSSWYFPELPSWASQFNAGKPADRFAGKSWAGGKLPARAGQELYRAIDATPFADQLVLDFALRLIEAENLGGGANIDLLSVSFSAMDYLGHASGTDTPQMHEMILSIDEKIGLLLQAAEKQAGRGKVLVVMTADHGVSEVPEKLMAKQLPAGRFDAREQAALVERALAGSFGDGEYILADTGGSYYLDYAAADDVEPALLEQVAAGALRGLPQVSRVYTRGELLRGGIGAEGIDRLVVNGFNRHESGDLIVIYQPNWLSGSSGTTHGSPYSYDTHVPLIFWGAPALVKPGSYAGEVHIQDIAPTLSALLRIAEPSGTFGRVLEEMMP